jgi:hypothetical protein
VGTPHATPWVPAGESWSRSGPWLWPWPAPSTQVGLELPGFPRLWPGVSGHSPTFWSQVGSSCSESLSWILGKLSMTIKGTGHIAPACSLTTLNDLQFSGWGGLCRLQGLLGLGIHYDGDSVPIRPDQGGLSTPCTSHLYPDQQCPHLDLHRGVLKSQSWVKM